MKRKKFNWLDKIPEFNDKQLNRLSEYLANFSLLMFASLVIPNFIGNNELNIAEMTSGMILTFLLLFISINIIRKKDE